MIRKNRPLLALSLSCLFYTRKIMSVSSSDKTRAECVSLDGEDSGHDSVDEPQSALEDRERINQLETAVAWIRGEVVNNSFSY